MSFKSDAFAQKIHNLRTSHGYTQGYIADKLKIDRTTYNKYESGECLPRIEKVDKLAQIFHTTPDYLLGYKSTTDEPLSNSHALALLSMLIIRELKNDVFSLNTEELKSFRNSINDAFDRAIEKQSSAE